MIGVELSRDAETSRRGRPRWFRTAVDLVDRHVARPDRGGDFGAEHSSRWGRRRRLPDRAHWWAIIAQRLVRSAVPVRKSPFAYELPIVGRRIVCGGSIVPNWLVAEVGPVDPRRRAAARRLRRSPVSDRTLRRVRRSCRAERRRCGHFDCVGVAVRGTEMAHCRTRCARRDDQAYPAEDGAGRERRVTGRTERRARRDVRRTLIPRGNLGPLAWRVSTAVDASRRRAKNHRRVVPAEPEAVAHHVAPGIGRSFGGVGRVVEVAVGVGRVVD